MRRAVLIGLGAFLLLLIVAGAWLYTPDLPRETLLARYPGEDVEVAGLRLRVRDTGPRDRPALLMIHGFGSSLQAWDAWAAALDGDYRVIRFDLPGFGLTGADPTNDYSDRRTIEVMTALLDRLGLGRATVIGNSLGGRIAWMFAAARPERIERVVLISPDGFASRGFAYGVRPTVPPLLRLLPYVAPRFLLRQSVAPSYADPARFTEATLTRYHDMLLAPGVRRAILARTEQVLLADPAPVLRTIQAPVLLLWGEQDAMIPVANAQDYLKLLPRATMTSLPGLGHIPFEEAPEVALRPLRGFLLP